MGAVLLSTNLLCLFLGGAEVLGAFFRSAETKYIRFCSEGWFSAFFYDYF